MSQPIFFEPIAMDRVWGGRRFESVLGKRLPQGTPIGELWELVDREDAQSVVHAGKFAGKTLHDLWTSHRNEVFGEEYSRELSPRFPLLVKLLDARERLSVQVHPPAHLAQRLGGESKTEVWYFLDALPGARIYAGLKAGVTRTRFEELLRKGEVESALHQISVHTGESIFIPSGRLHAIGEGNMIIEVQQNSDTTYRVYDWNRLGLDGRPRNLHVEQSMLSIDFEDFEPEVLPAHDHHIADCPFFRVEKIFLESSRDIRPRDRFALVAVSSGSVACQGNTFRRGDFFIVPAAGHNHFVEPVDHGTEILVTTLPTSAD